MNMMDEEDPGSSESQFSKSDPRSNSSLPTSYSKSKMIALIAGCILVIATIVLLATQFNGENESNQTDAAAASDLASVNEASVGTPYSCEGDWDGCANLSASAAAAVKVDKSSSKSGTWRFANSVADAENISNILLNASIGALEAESSMEISVSTDGGKTFSSSRVLTNQTAEKNVVMSISNSQIMSVDEPIIVKVTCSNRGNKEGTCSLESLKMKKEYAQARKDESEASTRTQAAAQSNGGSGGGSSSSSGSSGNANQDIEQEGTEQVVQQEQTNASSQASPQNQTQDQMPAQNVTASVPSNQTSNLCVDSDGGLNYAEGGKVTLNKTVMKDYCGALLSSNLPAGYLFEQYCDANGKMQQNATICQFGCTFDSNIEAYCMTSAAQCADSDGGIDYYVPGRTQIQSDYGSESYLDNFEITKYLYEAYCDAVNGSSYIKYECPAGVSGYRDAQGHDQFACIPSTAVCLDSDKGAYNNVSGTVYWGALNGSRINSTVSDYCGATTGIGAEQYAFEQYCDINGKPRQQQSLCPNGCSQGSCIQTSSPCTDSDGGIDANVAGSVTKGTRTDLDYGGQDNGKWYVWEQYCDANGNIASTRIMCESNTAVWENGKLKCIPLSASCSDTDGGNNVGVAGNLTLGTFSALDYCGRAISGRQYIIENYCDANGAYATEVTLCPGLCSQGACVGVQGTGSVISIKAIWNAIFN